MINPLHITNIVRDTLSDMEIYTSPMEILIKGTFLMESDLTNMYSDGKTKHGFMMMRDNDISYICKEYVKFKPNLIESIHTATGIDVGAEELEVILSEADSNIRLMVALLYSYYNSKNDDVPDDNLESIALFYRKHYDQEKTTLVEDFVDYYKEVFIN
jgi:hypothetical protein